MAGISMAAFGLSSTLIPWMIFAFLSSMLSALINSSNQGIWQAKVPPDVQGRVFASRRLIAWLVSPVSQLVAGPLADYIFEPGMQTGKVLNAAFGWLFGSDAGSGMALQLTLGGIFSMVVGLGGYLFATVRNAEDIIPDHDADTEIEEPVPASATA